MFALARDSRFVLWVVDNKQDIIRILSIFDRYPFLTSRTTLQLRFMRHCLQHNDISRYFNERELKYADRSNVISDFSNINLLELPYYPAWLSGFIEAESCFSVRNAPHYDVYSFAIGQNHDKYLIESIKLYFQTDNSNPHIVRNPNKNFFLLEIYRKETLLSIFSHLSLYPLLGNKHSQALTFFSKVFY